jgi:predicted site-specific integrase-resolvase
VQIWPYFAAVHDFNVWWVVVYVRVTGDWNKTDGDRNMKKSCDWSDTKELTVPIALTLIVKMNCSGILALLSCGS